MSSNEASGIKARLGLAAKFNILAIALIFFASSGVALFLMRQEIGTEFQRLNQQGSSTLMMISEIAEYATFTADREQLTRILDAAAASPDVSFIALYGPRGNLLARRRLRGTDDFGLPASVPRALLAAGGPEVLATPTPSYSAEGEIVLGTAIKATSQLALPGEERRGSLPAGFVILGVGLEGLQQRLNGFALSTTAVTLFMILAGSLVTVLVTRRVVAPVRNLTGAVQAVAEGDLDRRVAIHSGDEFGLLGAAFNTMTSRLRETREKLEISRRTLEQKVAERTEDLKHASERAYHLAQHDALTGLPNRTFVIERLRNAVLVAERRRSRLAVLFLDIDHFKRVNDSLGHDMGDQLLQVIAERLLDLAQQGSLLARLGGDEFVLMLDDLRRNAELADVASVAQMVIEAFRKPVNLQGHEVAVSTSIGIAMYPDDGASPALLLKNADLAMYSAKESGRAAYRFFTADMNTRVRERLSLENGLRRALERNELVLHFQPQFNARSGELTGAEALMRWRHPERGLLGPNVFIRIAEEAGMIRELGHWALLAACRQAREWLTRYGAPQRISVNLSARQLAVPGIVEQLKSVLYETRLNAQHLELEITESAVVEDPDRDIAVLTQIRALGVSLAVDDFGTGYSNLAYLTRLPIHALKIDRGFVAGVGTNRNDEAVVQAIVAMASQLKLRTIAEGVEDEEQGRFLAHIGCDELQGFRHGEPETAADFERLFLANRAAGTPPVSLSVVTPLRI